MIKSLSTLSITFYHSLIIKIYYSIYIDIIQTYSRLYLTTVTKPLSPLTFKHHLLHPVSSNHFFKIFALSFLVFIYLYSFVSCFDMNENSHNSYYSIVLYILLLPSHTILVHDCTTKFCSCLYIFINMCSCYEPDIGFGRRKK